MKVRKLQWGLVILVIFIFISVGFYFYIEKGRKIDNKVLSTVKNHYTKVENGLIHAYPDQSESQYLSESIGLYMEYLIESKNKEAFDELYYAFQQHFIVTKRGKTFIKWQLDDQTNTNALIDDVRIVAALQRASDIFHEPTYKQLAVNIRDTLTFVQKKDGYYTDFYDWSFEKPAARITLSYLTSDFFSLFPNTEQTKELLILPGYTEVFFPEYYNIDEKSYVKSETVHMIDQLLISRNRNNIGCNSDVFNEWLMKEWMTSHKLYGQYNRHTLQPAVSYESLSVYYYLHDYFVQFNKQKMADEVMDRAKQLAGNPVQQNAHFFDYIHYQLLETSRFQKR
ncbi:hypothetical protein [Fredinandcohnia quinoae]|uniref:Glycoside transferase n=1 Tax=Fredinandcohnia quinoae TaxID=2918902 RepID=A0AAW5E648_9BACI|nr:hypothetical protein [Fredinandcohnia sp. SECRCQ15]MCH1624603.1 hypothetical protein [Fredinandcohnia sp. SECRCQ15]